jgi:hypothetical protein
VDDDDTAWKVRKSAIKIIEAIIVSCPLQLKDFWFPFVNLLSSRFIERDNNVKCEILETFQTLVKASYLDEDDHMFVSSMKKARSYTEQMNEILP